MTPQQVAELDSYQFLALFGKKVIHPGSRVSTDKLLDWAALDRGARVLDVGCGVGTTAIRSAREPGPGAKSDTQPAALQEGEGDDH